MKGTEKPLGSVPNRLDDDLLDIYRLMPSHDLERLLSHIAWMEKELTRVQTLQSQAERKLKKMSALLNQQHEVA